MSFTPVGVSQKHKKAEIHSSSKMGNVSGLNFIYLFIYLLFECENVTPHL